MPKVARKCHPEAQPKDLANEKEILRFAQNDSFAVTLAHFRQFRYFLGSDKCPGNHRTAKVQSA